MNNSVSSNHPLELLSERNGFLGVKVVAADQLEVDVVLTAAQDQVQEPDELFIQRVHFLDHGHVDRIHSVRLSCERRRLVQDHTSTGIRSQE